MSRFTDALSSIWCNGKDAKDFMGIANRTPEEVHLDDRLDGIACTLIRQLGKAIDCEMKEDTDAASVRERRRIELCGHPKFGGTLCVCVTFEQVDDGLTAVKMSVGHVEGGEIEDVYRGKRSAPFNTDRDGRAKLESHLMFETLKCAEAIRDFKNGV